MGMADEFTFVLAKASLIIASSGGVVLFLAWVAAKKCFPEVQDAAVHEAFRERRRKALSSRSQRRNRAAA
jgi:hypothetical protein